ncbi:MAG: monovalent cation:proton antiporter-2 (CPA2) family protein, partial [Rhodospirillales bacterium]
MEHASGLTDILALLGAAVLAATLASHLGFGAILGYLAAGVIIGPFGVGLIGDKETMAHIGEFGVIFLLFLIGIEMKPQRLRVMRRLVFGLGSAQFVVTGLLLGAAAHWLGDLNWRTSIIIGAGLALSSTAFGVQILADRGQLNSSWGRAGFAILLLQDLAVVPLLAAVPLLAESGMEVTEGLGLAFLEAGAILLVVLIGGRFLLGPTLRFIARARNQDLFTAFALFLVLSAAFAMDLAGLSMAMGAFLAGILLAESEYRHQVEADIQPFRGLLLGLFFMSVGMGLDLGSLVRDWVVVLAIISGLIALKAAVIWALARLFGIDGAGAIQAALLLAQAGEFGFVVFGFAGQQGLLPISVSQPLVSAIALTMLATPFLAMAGARLGRNLDSRRDRTALRPHPDQMAEVKESPILIAGFGRVGRNVYRILTGLGVSCRAVDLNESAVTRARAEGEEVYFGDSSRADILRGVGADHARLLVITLDDPKAA